MPIRQMTSPGDQWPGAQYYGDPITVRILPVLPLAYTGGEGVQDVDAINHAAENRIVGNMPSTIRHATTNVRHANSISPLGIPLNEVMGNTFTHTAEELPHALQAPKFRANTTAHCCYFTTPGTPPCTGGELKKKRSGTPRASTRHLREKTETSGPLKPLAVYRRCYHQPERRWSYPIQTLPPRRPLIPSLLSRLLKI